MYKDRKYCGEITKEQIDKEILIVGWADTIRDHGGIIFIEVRDISGKIQTVFDSSIWNEAHKTAEKIKSEFVIHIKGTVRERSDETRNPNIPNGDIEIAVTNCEILNSSKALPFAVNDDEPLNEEVRLRYRFLDLRKNDMKNAMITRHKVMQATREYLSDSRFFEIETPLLNKSTPEGARDFLVPSRMTKGAFYALPQSPQLFKQILMISGYDRYFQIVKCFRDEDLRNDRQPEFTQIDLELSFVTPEMVINTVEGLLKHIIEAATDKKVELPFKRLTYKQAMDKYGTDAPDLRFGIEITDCSNIFEDSSFNVFTGNLKKGGVIKAIVVPDDPKLSRTVTDGYSDYVKQFGAGGFPMFKYIDGKLQGGIFKFISDKEKTDLEERLQLKEDSTVFFSSDKIDTVNLTLSNMRCKIAKDLDLIDESALSFLWVTEFPVFEYNKKEKRMQTMHHPFTAPKPEDLEKLDSITKENADQVLAQSYDIVLNGVEIGGGSIRINNPELQKKIFSILNISEEVYKRQFSFLLEALEYGAPTPWRTGSRLRQNPHDSFTKEFH